MITGEDIKTAQERAEKEAALRSVLSELRLEELYQLRGEQYTSKGDLIDDIIEADDGTLEEVLAANGSFISILSRPSVEDLVAKTISSLISERHARVINLNGERLLLIKEKDIKEIIDRHIQDAKQ